MRSFVCDSATAFLGSPRSCFPLLEKAAEKGEPKISLHARALRARPPFFVFCLHLFTHRALRSMNQQIEGEGFIRFCLHLSFTHFFSEMTSAKRVNKGGEGIWHFFRVHKPLIFSKLHFQKKCCLHLSNHAIPLCNKALHSPTLLR